MSDMSKLEKLCNDENGFVWDPLKDYDSVADLVNHPSHYTKGDIECIDAIKASMGAKEFIGYLKGNAIKYLWRYENKGGLQDLEKCLWYVNKLICQISNSQ